MSRYNYGRFIRQLCIKRSYLKQGGGGGMGVAMILQLYTQ